MSSEMLKFNSGINKKEDKSPESTGTIANASEKKPVLFTPAPETAGTIASSESPETAGTIASTNSAPSGGLNITA